MPSHISTYTHHFLSGSAPQFFLGQLRSNPTQTICFSCLIQYFIDIIKSNCTLFTFNINNEWLETFNCPRIICRCRQQEILKRKTFDRKPLKIKGSRAFLVNIWPTKIGQQYHHKAFTERWRPLMAFSKRFTNYTSFSAF